MNTKTLLPLSAAVLFTLCAGSMVLSTNSYADNASTTTVAAAPAAARVVDLPAVTVTPDAADLNHYLAYKDVKVVNLPAVTVHPESHDLAYYLATQTASVVDMPAITVRPSADDLRVFAAQAGMLARQLAAR